MRVLPLVRHNSNNGVATCLLRSSKSVIPVCGQWRGWRNSFTSIRKSILKEKWERFFSTSPWAQECFFYQRGVSFADIPSDLSVQVAGEARGAPGSGHSDDEHFWFQAQVPHQTCVPPPVQWLPPAVQEERVSRANVTFPPGSAVPYNTAGFAFAQYKTWSINNPTMPPPTFLTIHGPWIDFYYF